jgi:nitrate reductase beta subunit
MSRAITGKMVKCLVCPNKFWAFPYRIKVGKDKFCSRKCFGKFHYKEPKVKIPGTIFYGK